LFLFLFGMDGTLRGAKNGSFNSLLRRKHFRHALADDDARRMGIPCGDSWHDGVVGHPEVLDPIDTQLRVDFATATAFRPGRVLPTMIPIFRMSLFLRSVPAPIRFDSRIVSIDCSSNLSLRLCNTAAE
jgi:hypothetical protein